MLSSLLSTPTAILALLAAPTVALERGREPRSAVALKSTLQSWPQEIVQAAVLDVFGGGSDSEVAPLLAHSLTASDEQSALPLFGQRRSEPSGTRSSPASVTRECSSRP